MKGALLLALAALLFGLAVSLPLSVSAADNPTYQALPKPGAKVPLDANHYFIFGFEKPPKLGNAIMKLEIFTRDGTKDRSFAVTGDLDMPSMRGAHSNSKEFAISSKGHYLMPVRLVMPGTWEFRFSFVKNGVTLFRGAHLFDL
jgi:hypothetical protein